ncbi:MAG: response regulator transcription factor [Clostridiales bacterium]|nr:response regulator transcription factor [Clostridiales bacterium]
MQYDCLVVDDEVELGQATCEYFEMFNISAKHVFNSEQCLEALMENEIKLILLDINLDQESGFNLCKKIREMSNLPILFISARQSDDDVLIALNIGGDDYIKKPYSLSVLLAKVKVILKRLEESNTVRTLTIKEKGLVLDEKAMKVYVDGNEVRLKTKEFRLLYYLYQHKNKVISKQELFANVWGDEFFSDGTLNVHIRKIREKIEKNPNEPEYIKTIWGTGYILEL